MPINPVTFAKELSRLRKGRGVLRQDVLEYLGPEIRQLCGISGTDNAEAARKKLNDTVHQLLSSAPEVRRTVLAALALHPDAKFGLLRERQAWLIEQLGCAPRTIRRRVNRAFNQLVTSAEKASERPATLVTPVNPTGTYLTSVDALLRLDGPSPELTEHRSVIFTRDGVDEIVTTFSLPKVEGASERLPELSAEVIYGGRLRRLERISDVAFCLTVELPHKFNANDTHRYGVVFRPAQPIRPHYTVQPLTVCERFDLTIRFDPNAVPERIWRLNGTLLRVVDELEPKLEQVQADRLGELRLTFEDLQPGQVYGAKWLPARVTPDRMIG